MNEQVKLGPCSDPCWKCNGPLWQLAQPYLGWSHYCQQCKHLTSTPRELLRAMEHKPRGSVGVVAAIPCEIRLLPEGTSTRETP